MKTNMFSAYDTLAQCVVRDEQVQLHRIDCISEQFESLLSDLQSITQIADEIGNRFFGPAVTGESLGMKEKPQQGGSIGRLEDVAVNLTNQLTILSDKLSRIARA